jgi:hypothetical protein
MKKMLFLIVCVFFAVTTVMNAQPPQMPSPEERAKQETESMKKKLDLSPEQLPVVEKINLKYAEKMDAMFQQSGGPGGDFSEMDKKMKSLEIEKRDELTPVLNEDQLKQYDKMVAENHKKRQGPPPQQE